MENLSLSFLIFFLFLMLGVTWLLVYQRTHYASPIVPDWLCFLGLGISGFTFVNLASEILHRFTDPPQVHHVLSVLLWFVFVYSCYITFSNTKSEEITLD